MRETPRRVFWPFACIVGSGSAKRDRGVDVTKLKVLHTTPDALEAGTVYAVDVAKRVLVEKRKLTASR